MKFHGLFVSYLFIGILFLGCDESSPSRTGKMADLGYEAVTTPLSANKDMTTTTAPENHLGRQTIAEVKGRSEKYGISAGAALSQIFEEKTHGATDSEEERIARNLATDLRYSPRDLIAAVAETDGLLRHELVEAALGRMIVDLEEIQVNLEDLYKVLPESDDRRRVAQSITSKIFYEAGLVAAVSNLQEFEGTNDKHAALDDIRMKIFTPEEATNFTVHELTLLLKTAQYYGYEQKFKYLEEYLEKIQHPK